MDFVARFKENAPSKQTLLIVIIFTSIAIFFYVQHIRPLIYPKFLGNDEFWPKDSSNGQKNDGKMKLFYAEWCDNSKKIRGKWINIQNIQKQKYNEYLSKGEDDDDLDQTKLYDLLIDRRVKLEDPILVDDQNVNINEDAIKKMESELQKHNIKPSTIDRFPSIYFLRGNTLIEFSAEFNEENLIAFLKGV